MIVSRTPYRVSWAGGGTDLPAFCDRESGAVLSTTIDLGMHVTVHRRFEPNWRVCYDQTEITDQIEDIQHELVREALKLTEVTEPVEITTIGDVPAGTGLGSSSSLTVGLLHALYVFKGQPVTAWRLAEEACRIEIDILGKPIGRQDQYAAAFGGINWIEFGPDGQTAVRQIDLEYGLRRSLEQHSLLFFTGQTRNAEEILAQQSAATKRHRFTLRAMRDLVGPMVSALRNECFKEFGRLLHDGWQLKRSLGCGIETPLVESWYHAAIRAKAWGGKLLGAGGSGFLLIVAPPKRHEAIRQALGRPREIPFRIGGPSTAVKL